MKIFYKFIALTLFVVTAYGGNLTSVNNDTCWYKEESNRVKIASFNDQVSLNTNRDLILGELVQYLDSQNFTASKIDSIHTYGLCGPQLMFAIRISYEKVNYCIRANIENKTKLNFSKVALASSTKGACEQIGLNKLIVTMDEKNSSALKNELAQHEVGLKSYKRLTNSSFVLEFKTQRDEIRDIKKIIESTKLARYVEFSAGQYHIADEFELLSISYFRK